MATTTDTETFQALNQAIARRDRIASDLVFAEQHVQDLIAQFDAIVASERTRVAA